MKPEQLLRAVKEYMDKYPAIGTLKELAEELQTIVDTEKMLDVLTDKDTESSKKVYRDFYDQMIKEYQRWEQEKQRDAMKKLQIQQPPSPWMKEEMLKY